MQHRHPAGAAAGWRRDQLVARDRDGATLDAGITHEPVNVRAGRRARGAFHIQNVNGWHSRFKNWLVRSKGVASRYLANYAGWQRRLDAPALRTPAQCLCAALRQAS